MEIRATFGNIWYQCGGQVKKDENASQPLPCVVPSSDHAINVDIIPLFSYMVYNIKAYTSSQLECVLPAKVDLPLGAWLKHITTDDCRP